MWSFLFISNHLQASGWELARPWNRLKISTLQVKGAPTKGWISAGTAGLSRTSSWNSLMVYVWGVSADCGKLGLAIATSR